MRAISSFLLLIVAYCEVCLVTDWDAKGDNSTEDTAAFQSALELCTKVVVPPGSYLLRPVKLHSNTILTILPGAILVAWSSYHGWPNSTTRNCSASPYESKNPETVPRLESLLYADAVENITINGGGSIDGQGWRWWPLRDKSEYWHHCRPYLIRIQGSYLNAYDLASKHLLFENITLLNSPSFNFKVHGQNVQWRYIKTVAEGCPLNTDSFNVGGNDLYIAHSNVHSGDDCIPIGKYSSNVLVENVTCACGNGVSPIIWNTNDTSSYIRNVTFRNMTFVGTAFAANIKSLSSYNGVVENIVFENFVFKNVRKAININLYGQTLQDMVGSVRVRNIIFRNFRGTAEVPGTFYCKEPQQCEGIRMEDVRLNTTGKYSCKGNVSGVVNNCSPEPCLNE